VRCFGTIRAERECEYTNSRELGSVIYTIGEAGIPQNFKMDGKPSPMPGSSVDRGRHKIGRANGRGSFSLSAHAIVTDIGSLNVAMS
jgi:hypothetical protein